MPDWPIWVWVLIVVIALIIIFAIIAGANQKKVADRQHAEELRSRATQDEHLLEKRRERADDLSTQAESSRTAAMMEAERAERLRQEAEAAEERAAYATEDAEVLITEADRSRGDYDSALKEHDNMIREADRRDPDIRTDRDGNRILGEDDHRGVDPDGDGLLDRDQGEDVRLRDAGRPLDDTRDARPIDVVDTHDRLDDDVRRDDRITDDYVNEEYVADEDGPAYDEQGRRLDPYGNPVEDYPEERNRP